MEILCATAEPPDATFGVLEGILADLDRPG
jgi:hypothetical protein